MPKFIIAAMASLFAFAAAAEVPTGVEIAKENAFAICSVLELTAEFTDGPPKEETVFKRNCANGFQVSPTEIVTVEHLTIVPQDALLTHFAVQAEAFAVHGFTQYGTIPVADMQVAHYFELWSSEGGHFKTPAVRFSATWGGKDPTEHEVLRLAKALEVVQYVEDSEPAGATLLITEPGTDLALFRLDVPLERSAYVEVSQGGFSLNAELWSIAARPPDMFSAVPHLVMNRGVIKSTAAKPNVEYKKYDPSLRVYMIMTDHLNYPGISGSANVDAWGRLGGVTTAASHADGKMSGFDVAPPCNTPIWNGSIMECSRALIPGPVVYQFLQQHSAE